MFLQPRSVSSAPAQIRRSDGAGIPEADPPRAVLRREALYRHCLATADVLSAALVGILAVLVLGDQQSLRPTALLALPCVAIVSKIIGLYDRDDRLIHKTTLVELRGLFQVATLYALVVWLGSRLVVYGTFSREQVVAVWLVGFAVMAVMRAVARRFAQRQAETERCLVVGRADSAERLSERFASTSYVNAVVVGRVPLHGEDSSGDDVVGSMNTLGLTLVEYDVHRVVIAPDESAGAVPDEVLDTIRLVKALGVNVSVLPRLFEVVGSSVEIDDIDGVVLLGVRRFGLTRSSHVLKRSFDLVASTLALILLAPLLGFIALAIKLTSPGPVLFRQKRIGRGGRGFVIFKFRTMCDDADLMKPDLVKLNEADGLFKIADDPRITSVGRLLRQTSLDKLPQLFNVLRGEMSLVGPRPLVPSEDCRVEGWRRRRLHIPPGMTGQWQIFGSSRVPLREMVKIDYLYGANWSLWGDVKILLRTVGYAFGRRGM